MRRRIIYVFNCLMPLHKVKWLHNSASAGPEKSSLPHSLSSRAMIYFALIFASAVLAEDACPRSHIYNFYRELNCEPVFENASKCPSSFVCPNRKYFVGYPTERARVNDYCNSLQLRNGRRDTARTGVVRMPSARWCLPARLTRVPCSASA